MKRLSVSKWAAQAVVVFVITFSLAGTLMSFPWNTRSERRRTCLNNIKECVIALHVYFNDYEASMPSSALVRHSKKWNKADFLTFATKQGCVPTPSPARPGTWVAVLWDDMRSKDTMFCPSDDSGKVSYWWKMAVDKAWFGVNCGKPRQKESDFAYQMDQMVLYEHNSWHEGEQKGLVNGAKINAGFMDGHAKYITLTNATTGDPFNCAANADGEPMYFNCNGDTGVAIPKEKAAKYVDTIRYCDRF